MVEALERQLAGDLGVVGHQRLVGHLGDHERVLESLGVEKTRPPSIRELSIPAS